MTLHEIDDLLATMTREETLGQLQIVAVEPGEVEIFVGGSSAAPPVGRITVS